MSLRRCCRCKAWVEMARSGYCRACKRIKNQEAYRQGLEERGGARPVHNDFQLEQRWGLKFGLLARVEAVSEAQRGLCACCKSERITGRRSVNVQPVFDYRKGLRRLVAILCYRCWQAYNAAVRNVEQPRRLAKFLEKHHAIQHRAIGARGSGVHTTGGAKRSSVPGTAAPASGAHGDAPGARAASDQHAGAAGSVSEGSLT